MESDPPFDAEVFSHPVATSVQRSSRTREILPVLLGRGFTVIGAAPETATDREVSQSTAASRLRILPRERGQECKHLVTTWLERTASNRLVDWGQHSMIQERMPWLTVMCPVTGVST